jgi:methionyl-tRNA formyltransferase
MRIIFIGNRYNVLECLMGIRNIKLDIFSVQSSTLEKTLLSKQIPFTPFEVKDKKMIIDKIYDNDFDILISNGCPFIIPIAEIINSKILINIHPTFLPYLRGKTPLNGIFYEKIKHLGATMHYLSDEIDGGNIIYQERIPVTEDIDQGLVYFLSFQLEAIIFKKGWNLLTSNNFSYKGFNQNSEEACYFNRSEDKMVINFASMNTEEIIRRTKSFGIIGQGCRVLNCNDIRIKKVYDALPIINPFLLDFFNEGKPGQVLLDYDNKLLIRTLDGVIKIIRHE